MVEPAALDESAHEEILRPACDYIESWLDGDAERMAGCLHTSLVKREIERDAAGRMTVDTMSRDDMISATAEGYGKRYERPYEATVLDAFEEIATVRVLSSVYMDYLHVARLDGEWLIVNVLWQRRPGR